MTSRTSFAPGKIILSGEYAVLFGFPGVAVPFSRGIHVLFEENSKSEKVEIQWENGRRWLPYAEKIVELCTQQNAKLSGTITIESSLSLGKGMGSSTALIIATVRALLGDVERDLALRIEGSLNPGHSGLDFAAIWKGAPILFRDGISEHINLPPELLRDAILIDTGHPSESTTELVAWVRTREKEIQGSLKTIGRCTDRLANGEPLFAVVRDHHRAQLELGVVPPGIQELIAEIEQAGGAAKVTGAGAQTGGAGMVLALGDREKMELIAGERGMPIMTL